MTEEAVTAEWQSIDAVKAAAEQPVITTMQTIWQQQRAEVLEKLPGVLDSFGIKNKEAKASDLIAQQLFDQGTWDQVLLSELEPHLAGAVQEGFLAGALRVSLDLSSAFEGSLRTQSVLETVLGKTKGVNQTTAQDLAEGISRGLQENESLEEITRRVEGYFDSIQSWRAKMISQTSVTPAFEVSQQEAFRTAGIERGKWVSQRDSGVRSSHADADGQIRELGTAFDVGGAKLEYPGDPTAPASAVINCRCTTFPVLAEKSSPGSYLDERNAAIRSAYPALLDQYGEWGAFYELGQKHGLSEHTVRDVVREKGHYSP